MARDMDKKYHTARQLAKSTALNKIRKLYRKGGFEFDRYSELSYSEQVQQEIFMIIDELERKLKYLRV